MLGSLRIRSTEYLGRPGAGARREGAESAFSGLGLGNMLAINNTKQTSYASTPAHRVVDSACSRSRCWSVGGSSKPGDLGWHPCPELGTPMLTNVQLNHTRQIGGLVMGCREDGQSEVEIPFSRLEPREGGCHVGCILTGAAGLAQHVQPQPVQPRRASGSGARATGGMTRHQDEARTELLDVGNGISGTAFRDVAGLLSG